MKHNYIHITNRGKLKYTNAEYSYINLHIYNVDGSDFSSLEKLKPVGNRLTIFNCTQCKLPLSEKELSSIRSACAPREHYECYIKSQKKSLWNKLKDIFK